VTVLKFRPKPSITANAILPKKAKYAYKVDLIHPLTRELISSHIFRKNERTPDPQEAALQFVDVIASPSVVVSDVIRIRETIH
jgi:hypothetical protein